MNNPTPRWRHPAAPRRNVSRRGFTLIHMLTAIPLVLSFAFFASRLFISNNSLLNASAAEHGSLVRSDMAVHQLRVDAWTGVSVIADGDALTISRADEPDINWRATDDGSLTRTHSGGDPGTKHFEAIGAVRFESRPGAVVLVIGSSRYLCPIMEAKP